MALSKQDIKNAMKGRTPDQKKVIQYFVGSGGEGCGTIIMDLINKPITDQQYDAMVTAAATSVDFKQKALGKIGLDEDQVKEIEPVHFEGFVFDTKKAYAKRGKDSLYRSSTYQITWLFFSATQVYVYQYTFDLDTDTKNERTEEYFYKDITNLTTVSDTVEKEYPKGTSCSGKSEWTRENVDSNRFSIVVPGEKFMCSMKKNDYTEKAIQGMKAKLREKKT